MSFPLVDSRRFRSLVAIAALPLALAACPALTDRGGVPREDLLAACQGYDAALGQLAQMAATPTMHPAVREAADAACEQVRERGR